MRRCDYCRSPNVRKVNGMKQQGGKVWLVVKLVCATCGNEKILKKVKK